MTADAFLAAAREAYIRVNARTLDWMLRRPHICGAFLNTKVDSLCLRDYGQDDGWRGPGFIYGWIQGRGLEALICHARFFATRDPHLAGRLRVAASALYRALGALYRRHGHGYFCYDAATLDPVASGPDDPLRAVSIDADRFTYSDVFIVKGLYEAASEIDPQAVPLYLGELKKIVAAVEEHRLYDEREVAAGLNDPQPVADYGPQMILLSVAAMLQRFGYSKEAESFGPACIEKVLRENWDGSGGPGANGAMRDRPGDDIWNPGHAIEFAGFALDYLGPDADGRTIEQLRHVFLRSFEVGFRGPGICLVVKTSSGEPASPLYPWWALPEAIRTAALVVLRTGCPKSMAAWRASHDAFFGNYWREEPPLAYQMRDLSGPIDSVPATPDLDPAYHTGLSLLAATRVIDKLQ